MKKVLVLTLLVCGLNSFAQTVLLDENFTNGIPTTWTTIDGDLNAPVGVAEFTDAWIGHTTLFDTCAASTSYYLNADGNEDTTAISADYLITPKLSLLTFGNLLTWDAKSLDGSFPDGYEVLISTTDSLAASFTTVLKTVTSESPYWTSYQINLMTEGFVNQDVFIAFKNTTENGYILQLDNIKVTGDDPASVSLNQNVSVSIYPNPVATILTIETSNLETVQISNGQGKVVMESNLNQINVSQFPKGIYFIEVKTQTGLFKKRFIKI